MIENKENKKELALSYMKKILKREKKLFIFLFVIFLFIIFIPKIADQYLLKIPKPGGNVAEIHIGSPPRFINPVLASSSSDRDLLPFIYSSLLKRDINGKITPSVGYIALSENKKVYTVTLDEDVIFSDGKNLTAEDVIFTINKIQDPLIRSPYAVQWLGAKAEKIDDYTFTITLKSEYAQFTNILASLYILPKHLWFDIAPSDFPFSDLNIDPIGSGPYVAGISSHNKKGKISKYTLLKNKKYYAEELFIDKVSFYFFENYSDYKKSLIFSDKKIIKNIFSVSYDLLSDISGDVSYLKSSTISLESGRNFALFINPKNSSYLISKPLRKAISLVINSDNIIEKTLQGHGQNISSFQDLTTSDKISEAKKILSADFTFTNESGKNILISNKSKEVVNIELSILDSSEFRNIAKLIQEDLEVLGIGIDVISYSESDLIENAVRGREFEMLLFGYQTDVSLADTYYLFHSSQISDPGINISNFSNSTADNLILDLRKNIDDADRFEKTKELYDLIISESAYIPLYSPNYIYVMDSRIQNFSMKTINSREDRFRNFATWYSRTEKILPFFNSEEF